MHKPPVIFLMGPTASGKTETAVDLVRELPCDIVSVDSALVYRGMDIGTAKPSPKLLAEAPHRLIDILNPVEPYSAARFRNDALREMADIGKRGRVPLLVGGTGLYFRALEQGLSPLPSADAEVRSRLEREAVECGWPVMHRRLMKLDPVSARRIHPNDPQRIQRALEVFELTGRTLSESIATGSDESLPYRVIKLILAPAERGELHQRIERRFDRMLESGFIDEVATLRGRGDLHPGLPSMRAVGYRQIWEYLDGHYAYPAMIERSVIATRQLAKRQFTWLRAEQGANWIDSYGAGVTETALKYLDKSIS